MSSMPIDEIDPQNLDHEADVTLQDIAYLTRRYVALYRRRYPARPGNLALLIVMNTAEQAFIQREPTE